MANIKLNNNSYPIPDSALAIPTADFVAHLGTIAGSGMKVVVGGVEYGIDSSKVAGAVSALDTAFGELENGGEERLEGDGAEYYTLAPTALSFRSTAPLNELQEVQINGVTVDPSNYTLEEGSTIVTFPIEYLKTLNVGSYEVAIASDSKTVKGDFTVAAPDLNEYGFYYNQPYAAYMAYFNSDIVMFIREDNTMDIMVIANNATETAAWAFTDGILTITSPSMGELHCTFSADGMELYNTELGATLSLNENETYAADEDYFYIYKEDLGGYEVTVIDKTKAEYSAIKTGINGIDTVALANEMFYQCFGLTSVIIPNSVTSIGSEAFYHCTNLTSVTIPDSVTSIGLSAFEGCTSLESVHITDIASWCGISFGGSTDSNPLYYAPNLYLNGELVTNLVIPDSVTAIGPYAFLGCCLTSVEIPDSVTSIGSFAFYVCDSLTSVMIGNGVTTIGSWAFLGCKSLTSVTIGDSVTSIGENALYACTSLTSITFNGTTAQWNAITKDDTWNRYVPATYVQCSDGQVAL